MSEVNHVEPLVKADPKKPYERLTAFRNWMNRRAYFPYLKPVETDQGSVPGAISASGTVYWRSEKGWRKLASGYANRCCRKPEVKGKVKMPVARESVSVVPNGTMSDGEKQRHWLRRGLELLRKK